MAFPPHARVQLEGRLKSNIGAGEIWSSGMALTIGTAGGSYLRDPQQYADAVAPALATWFGSGAAGMSNLATLEVVKVNNILPNGHYQDPVTHQHVYGAPVSGGQSPGAPAFTCVCTTWETGKSRGYAHRGRSYFPNNTWPFDGSYIPAGNIGAIVAAGKAFLTCLLINEPEGGALASPAVVSRHAGELEIISGVSVDSIYDYQSRRKNRLVSTRTTASFP